eukprot:g6155.t1
MWCDNDPDLDMKDHVKRAALQELKLTHLVAAKHAIAAVESADQSNSEDDDDLWNDDLLEAELNSLLQSDATEKKENKVLHDKFWILIQRAQKENSDVAVQTYTEAVSFVREDKTKLHVALLGRGNSYMQLSKFSEALDDYRASRLVLSDSDSTEQKGLSQRRRILLHCAKFAKASFSEALQCSFTTLLLQIIIILCGGWNWDNTMKWRVPLLALVRLRFFMIFHDCAHHAFFPRWHFQVFKNKFRINEIMGKLVGAIVYTPYNSWSVGHRTHHQTVNNINIDQIGQISSPWSVGDFNTSTLSKKLWYIFNFGPLTYFTCIPFISIVIEQRIYATWIENGLTCLFLYLIYLYYGFSGLQVEAIVIILFTCIGYLLFHIQHTFEDIYKANDEEWDWVENGLGGCSYAQIPFFLKPFTLGIEYHHIHHLNPQIPSYKLEDCHNSAEVLFTGVKKIYFTDFINSLGFSLYRWDEKEKRCKYINVYSHCFEFYKKKI